MKKILLLLVAMVASVTFSSAQTFVKGDNVATAKVGFFGGYGVPVSIGYERGIYDFNETMGIGLGADLGFGAVSGAADYMITVSGRYHYVGLNNFDLYAGLSLGADIQSVKSVGTYSYFVWGINVGARYYFNDWIGVTAELGYGMANLNLGVCFKF